MLALGLLVLFAVMELPSDESIRIRERLRAKFGRWIYAAPLAIVVSGRVDPLEKIVVAKFEAQAHGLVCLEHVTAAWIGILEPSID